MKFIHMEIPTHLNKVQTMSNILKIIASSKIRIYSVFLKSFFFFFLFSFAITNHSVAQTENSYFHKSSIKTIQLYKAGWKMSFPIIQLKSNDRLVLSFDDLGEETKNYNYTIVHCDHNWNPSELLETEYMKGYAQNPLTDYQFSFNTKFIYTHYKLVFPNQDFQILKSGNYLIKIYEDNNKDEPVITWPFMVYEPLVQIVPRIKYSTQSSLNKQMQEIDFTIRHPRLIIDNPIDEIKVNIMQNGRLDNQITNLKPVFIRAGELVYDYNRENLFEGGNEFRWLDIRSTRFAPEYVKAINFHDPYYHFELFPSNPRYDKSYFYKEDFNGKYYIEVREYDDPDIEADYAYVHFSLPRKMPFSDGDAYVLGGLSNWQLNESNKMIYNAESMTYELTLLLKQGFYNYQYAFMKYGETKGSLQKLEGSFSQAENDYRILVYYKRSGDYYDHLVGVSISNSLKYTSP